jgi:hypothetical protein
MSRLPERNKIILKSILDGETLSNVGGKYGITTERTRQIVFELCRIARNKLEFHFRGEEWQTSLQFFREHKTFIYAALKI